jgi:AAA domain
MITPAQHRANVLRLVGEEPSPEIGGEDGPGSPDWPQPPDLDPEGLEAEAGTRTNNDHSVDRESALTLYTEEELAKLPAPTWQADRIIPAGGNTLLVGRKTSYKTFIALDLAASIATGADWHGHATVRATVVYIAGEGRSGIGARLAAIRSARGIRSTNILVYPAPLALLAVASADRLADGLLAKLETEGPTLPLLTVWDTLHRCLHGADENDSATAGLAYGTLDRLREHLDIVTSLFIHHPPKVGDEGRGSSSWEDDADAIWTTEREAGSRLVTLKNTKQKDFEEHNEITLEVIPAADSLVVTSHGADWRLSDHRSLTPGERKALDCLSDFHPEAIAWTRWREAAGLSDASLSRHRKRLVGLGYIEIATSGKHARHSITGPGMAALT